MRTSVVALAALAMAFASPALAQKSPTADQIIAALKPTGQIHAGTRGIRAIAPGATAVGAVARRVPVAARPSIDLNVHFDFGSAELTPEAAQALDELGRALSSAALAGYRFRIEGHTDTVGTEEFNKTLSDQRAATVARYLESRFGVAGGRLETVGLGESELAVPTPPQTPDMRNRRVHVVNLGA